MILKNSIFILLFFLGTHNLFSASKIQLIKLNNLGDSLWTKKYGKDSVYSKGHSIEQTSDGGYIFVGYAVEVYYPYLIRTDSLGDTLWTKIFHPRPSWTGLYSVKQTHDRGYILAGVANDSTDHSYPMDDVYLMKTDSLGNKLWAHFYGGTCSEYGSSVQQTKDDGYIVSGWKGNCEGHANILLLKTNSLGDSLWMKSYGLNDYDDFCDSYYSVQQTTYGGYITVGRTQSFGAGKRDAYIIKTDSLGDTSWTRTFGGIEKDGANSVDLTKDGGYIISGYTWSNDHGAFLMKLDSLGDTIWVRIFRDTLGYHFSNETVQQTIDGGYIVGGDYNHIWKTDSLGKLQWINKDINGKVRQTNDGGYIAIRTIYAPGGIEEDTPIIFSVSQGSPNPFNNITSINYKLTKRCQVKIIVYSMLGQVIRELENEIKASGKHTIIWDGQDERGNKLPNGFYFLKIEAGDNKATRKLILLR